MGRFAAAAAILIVCAGPVTAAELYRSDKFEARLDTTVTAGMALRVEERDDALIFRGNDPENPTKGSTAGFFTNADDGNLNYDQGDIYSAAGKVTLELETRYNTGLGWMPDVRGFFRGFGFYDVVANDGDNTQRTDLSRAARQRNSVIDGGVVGTQWLFLDAYLDGTFNILDHNYTLRVGNQVVNWGEAIFTSGGINATNAYDVTALRIPGSELREALVPAPMVRLATNLIGDLSAEAYFQFHWNRTNVDPTGSYWATSDVVGRGAEGIFFGNDPGGTGIPAPQLIAQGRGIPKIDDDRPSDRGQWGVALRYYLSPILTEFGLYYLHYDNKIPGVGNTAVFITSPSPQPVPTAFFRQYTSDIDVIGASFGSEILTASVNGEISYRPREPTGVVATGIAMAKAIGAGPNTPVRANSYTREERLQAAINMTQIFGPSTRWGIGRVVEFSRADSFSLTSEMGVTYYPSLSRQCPTPLQPLLDAFTGTTTDCQPYQGVGVPDADGQLPGTPSPSFGYKSDVNATSAGYQMFLRGEYTNPFNVPITINPTLAWRHDFRGTTPNATFIENRKAISLGVTVDYLQTYGASLTYSNYLHEHRKDLVHDRDFVSMNLTYRF